MLLLSLSTVVFFKLLILMFQPLDISCGIISNECCGVMLHPQIKWGLPQWLN